VNTVHMGVQSLCLFRLEVTELARVAEYLLVKLRVLRSSMSVKRGHSAHFHTANWTDDVPQTFRLSIDKLR
jgi:hypothetical protein